MKPFSIAAADQYAFDVNVILLALTSQLKPLNTSDFKKDAHDYLGFPSSPLSPPITHLSSFCNPMRSSFRIVLEKIGNPLDPLPNHHFQTFLSHFTKWQTYRDRGGSMSLYGYVQNSPAVFDIYLTDAKA